MYIHTHIYIYAFPCVYTHCLLWCSGTNALHNLITDIKSHRRIQEQWPYIDYCNMSTDITSESWRKMKILHT